LKRLFGNKKGKDVALPFSPNLTINLTYLCYGPPKVRGTSLEGKAFGRIPLKTVEMQGLGTIKEKWSHAPQAGSMGLRQ
jgi:hypothetical protein